jgi:hypothetical protein
MNGRKCLVWGSVNPHVVAEYERAVSQSQCLGCVVPQDKFSAYFSFLEQTSIIIITIACSLDMLESNAAPQINKANHRNIPKLGFSSPNISGRNLPWKMGLKWRVHCIDSKVS